MSDPLVSISCITYNHSRYLRQCLDSFMMQQCNFDFEVLIHDDASTDGTREIILEYQQRYPNVIKPILQIENQWSKGVRGISIQFNLPRAEGKYIAMCEGDDYWTDPLKLQKQFDFMESHPEYTLCTHDFVLHYEHKENSDVIASDKFKYLKKVALTGTRFFQFTLKDFAIHLDGLHTSTNFFRADIVKESIDIPGCVTSGDYLLKLLLLSKGKGCFIPDAMSILRKNPGGVTQQRGDRMVTFDMQKKQLSFFAKIAPQKAKKYFYRRLWKIYPNYILARGYSLSFKERLKAIVPFVQAVLKSV